MNPKISFDFRETILQAFELLSAGETEQAQIHCEQLLTIDPKWAPAHGLEAAIALQRGDQTAAEAAFERAYQLEPLNPEYVYNLIQSYGPDHPRALELCQNFPVTKADADLAWLGASVLFTAGQSEMALSWLLQTEALQGSLPQPEVWNMLGLNLFANRHFSAARLCFEHMQAYAPDFAFASFHAGLACLRLGEFQACRTYLQKALVLEPALVEQLYRIGCDGLKDNRMAEADICFQLCEPHLTLLTRINDVQEAFFYRQQALCSHYLLDHERTAKCYQRAAAANPTINVELVALLALPYIYTSREELRQVRKRLSFRLDQVIENARKLISRQANLPEPALFSPGLLAYQGENDRAIMKKLGDFLKQVMTYRGESVVTQHAPQAQGRLKIGFASESLCRHSVMTCYGELISAFGAAADFECYAFHLGPVADDKSEWLKQRVQHFEHLYDPEVNVARLAQKIAQHKLDILIYPELGNTAVAYFLASHRLAPIQCALAGYPVTSGLPDIDYFFANGLVESPANAGHYTEQLLCLPTGFTNYNQITPPKSTQRPNLWAPDKHIYFCPMTLFKIHPDFDALLEQILLRDPAGEVWLVADRQRPLHEVLARRFASTIPAVSTRIRFMPWMSQLEFYQAIQAADAVLDSLHYGAGSTARMVLGLHQPLVTLPGKYLRSRITLGCYRIMELEDWVARSEAEFVDQCLRLSQDPGWRQHCQQQLRERSHRLFDRKSNPEDLMALMQQIVARYPEPVTRVDLP